MGEQLETFATRRWFEYNARAAEGEAETHAPLAWFESRFVRLCGACVECVLRRAVQSGGWMSFSQRLEEIREGFERPFWIANISEIFERIAYYATTAVLAVYLNEQLQFSSELTGWLVGTFGLVVWFLPILGGTLADRFGFRRALMFAYFIMSVGYFLLGSLGAVWMEPLRHALTDKWLVLAILMIPALGPGVVKPCVAGTTARASSENVRSIGYSIYYTLVNIGGALGPIVAFLVRKQLGWGVENVFRVASLSVFLMFWMTLFFYSEPSRSGEQKVASLFSAIKNMFVILANVRFVTFLVIFSGFFVMFWQQYISVPLFIRKFINPNANTDLLLSVDAIFVICFQIAVTFATRKLPAFTTMALGILITGLAWVIPAIHSSMPLFVVTLIFVALGEITQVSRYYEYVSRLAPPGQQGLYMGYAFLPIGVGYFIAGPLGGYLIHRSAEAAHPQQMWWVIVAVGVLTTLLLWIYDRIVKPSAQGPS
ncbi:MAG TPA: MFS transporter [Candidatus Methylomirabilis sp.]|nr:MFS transporter [Candidatus Methylomirabilis sp.]